MRATKKEYTCSRCKVKTAIFSGYCSSCGAAGTVSETSVTEVSRESPERKSIRRRWKTKERDKARRMTAVDGHDPAFKHIASSTGKIGMITGIRVDAVSSSYVTEIKNRDLPKWINDAWLLINQRSIDFDKHALLHMDPPNRNKDYVLNGVKYRLSPMDIITETRHESLITSEKKLNAVNEIMDSTDSNVVKVRKIKDVLES